MNFNNVVKSPKKYFAALLLICMIVTTYLAVIRNKQTWQNGNEQRKQNFEASERNISVRLSLDIQSRIKTLALFMGYPRSGHTLMGSLLDAHPHIIIANELDIFERWTEWTKEEQTRDNLINKLYENSYKQIFGRGFRSAFKTSGRTYTVPNQWQGKFKDYIKIIGDKKGGKTSKFLYKSPSLTNEVNKTMHIPIKLVHMVRNPFDNIATMLIRKLEMKTSDVLASKNKINNTTALASYIAYYFTMVQWNDALMNKYGSSVITLHSEDVIENPKKILKKLCQFFDVICTEEYLNDCASIIYKNPSRTRRAVVWPPVLKQRVERAITTFSFLRRYSFDS